MAVSAIIPSVRKIFSDTLVLVKYLVTSGERGVKGRVFSLSWRSKYGTGAERGKEISSEVAEHFGWCTTLLPSYPDGLKLVLSYM